MSLEHAYCSLDALKSRLGLDDADKREDEELEGIIEAVSRVIDAECFGGESQFYPLTATRYFTATSAGQLDVDDLLQLTALSTDLSGGGTYDLVWDTDDWLLSPYNAQSMSIPRPYRRIEAALLGPNRFPTTVPRGVRVAGIWGWCTDANRPKQVETVCLRESIYHSAATRTPYGMTTGDGSTATASTINLSNYSKMMLAPFRRVTVA